MSATDQFDKLIHSALRDSVREAQPSARAWGRIVEQIKRDDAAARVVAQPEIDSRHARRAATGLDEFDLNRSSLRGSGILSSWLRWTQLVHQVR